MASGLLLYRRRPPPPPRDPPLPRDPPPPPPADPLPADLLPLLCGERENPRSLAAVVLERDSDPPKAPPPRPESDPMLRSPTRSCVLPAFRAPVCPRSLFAEDVSRLEACVPLSDPRSFCPARGWPDWSKRSV